VVVSKPKRKPIIGILGGVGSGKSTVAAEFAKLGCAVIDADEIAHELLDKPSVKKKVVSFFSDAVLSRRGKIDRKKLANIVKIKSIQISNVMLICTRCNKPTRIGTTIFSDNKKSRICKKCRETIDQ